MKDTLLTPPPPHVPFVAGSLPTCPLARRLGIVALFGSCGSEPETHRNTVNSGRDWILLATVGGGGLIRCGSRNIEAGPSTMLVVPPGCAFRERAMPGGAWAWLCLRMRLAPGAPVFNVSTQTLWLGKTGMDAFKKMSDIISCLHGHRPGFMAESVARLIETLDIVADTMLNGPRREMSAFVREACALMQEHPGRNWHVAELARHCNMSVSSFAHLFRAETGSPPKQWLGEERIREARRLLADSQDIKEIADRLGYSSRYHFTRAFTRLEGIPPGRFQRLATRK